MATVELGRGSHSHTDVPDSELFAQLRAGDPRAMTLLYERHARQAYKLARRICVDPTLAEDVLQEAFLTVWLERPRYDAARGSFATWLLTIVHHRAVDEVRREETARHRRLLSMPPSQSPVAPGPSEAGWLHGGDVETALRHLPEGQREALLLAYYSGYTQREISDLLDLPIGTVKSRIYVGTKRLRILLRPLPEPPTSN